MADDGEDLNALLAELRAKTEDIAVTEHVGHLNRLFSQREEIVAKIEAHPAGTAALAALLDDGDPKVQLYLALRCKNKKINLDAALRTLQRLATHAGPIGWDAKSTLVFTLPEPAADAPAYVPRTFPFLPRPPGCGRAKAEEMVAAMLASERAQKVLDVLRASIRIWPSEPSGSPLASRFGGLPATPPGWTWPFAEDEPFVFLAQINCAELGALAKSHHLPDRGLLSFFGDHDDINGLPANGGAVYYFEYVSGLAITPAPMEEDEPLITCGMAFYETHEVPHPFSNAAAALGISHAQAREEWDAYFDLYVALAQFGFSDTWRLDENDISKLGGWPDLFQGELEAYGGRTHLLLQLGQFRDGTDLAGWGPGGLLYFTIRPDDLTAKSVERTELTVQCT